MQTGISSHNVDNFEEGVNEIWEIATTAEMLYFGGQYWAWCPGRDDFVEVRRDESCPLVPI